MSKTYAKVGDEWHEAKVVADDRLGGRPGLELQCTGAVVPRTLNPTLRSKGVGTKERANPQGLTLCPDCQKPETERAKTRALIKAKFMKSSAYGKAVALAKGKVVRVAPRK